MAESSERRLKPHPDVVYTEFDQTSAALLDLTTKRYYTLNETGSLIWSQFSDEGKEIGGIAERLTEVYEISLEDARRHVEEFLGELEREGLVVAG